MSPEQTDVLSYLAKLGEYVIGLIDALISQIRIVMHNIGQEKSLARRFYKLHIHIYT
jgi:hypothetical protein